MTGKEKLIYDLRQARDHMRDLDNVLPFPLDDLDAPGWRLNGIMASLLELIKTLEKGEK